MKKIQIGDTGDDVQKWQLFLTGQDFYSDVVDGIFGGNTKDATISFQKTHNLQPDGIVGNKTVGVAMTLGFDILVDDTIGKISESWPPKQNFPL